MSKDGINQPPTAEALAEIKAVAARAMSGDAAAVPRLREILAEYPTISQSHGNVAAHAERAWLDLAAGNDLYLRECVVKFAEDLRTRLTRPTASPVERLLVERAVACWLQMHYVAAAEAHAIGAKEGPRLLEYRAKRQARAQRMFQASLSALVTMQKLFPAAPAGELAPAVEEAAAALPPIDRPTGGGSEDTAGEVPNRVEAFFTGLLNGHRTAESVPAGAAD